MKAFSETNPRLQLAWDASSLKSYQFCPRHYQYANLEGWQSPSVDLAFGRLIASALERYQKARLDGKTIEDALVAVLKWAMAETYTEGHDDEGYCIDCVEHRAPDTQWGGRYETMWKCEGTEPYKNEKGNRAKCPYAFERSWFPGDVPDICVSCRSGIRTERRYIPDDDKKNRKSLMEAIVWYGLSKPENLDDGFKAYVFPDGRPAVELSGALPLPFKTSAANGHQQYILTYNMDYIGQFGSELFITDNKTTTKTLNEKYFDQYSPDTQFDTYDLIASIAFPALHISGTMVEGIQVMVSGVEIGMHPYYKTDEHREEHLADLEHWLNDAESSAISGYYRMNKRNCWLCPFKKVCSQAPAMREGYLRANFVKQARWDPLQQR